MRILWNGVVADDMQLTWKVISAVVDFSAPSMSEISAHNSTAYLSIISLRHIITENCSGLIVQSVRCVSVSVCPDNNLRSERSLTYIFGLLVHLDPAYVKFDGQGHRVTSSGMDAVD